MSGIVGLYRFDTKANARETLVSMTDAIAHRGPDDVGVWNDGPIGLGHRMLWTTPESLSEHLPLVNDSLVITADARIDNRGELLAALDLSALNIPDSSLILHSYARWGESCVDHLLGDFAFAIWDNDKRSLFCARDHMGVKPLYYYRSAQLFAFSSEVKALFCLPEVPRKVNEAWLAGYLVSIYDDDESTSYRDVMRVPPAHSVTISAGKTTFRRYWSLDPSSEVHFDTDAEYEQAFRSVFFEAVRCRLRSAFPVGSQLSGGLDSSSVTCVAREILRGDASVATPPLPLHTFSAVFDEVPQSDERPYITTVLAGGDLAPHYVHPDALSPLADAERMFWHADEACCVNANAYTSWALYKVAADLGVRVLLTGTWGDAVVSYGDLALTDYIRAARWRSALDDLRHRSSYHYASVRHMLGAEVLRPFAPGVVRNAWFLGRYRPDRLLSDQYFIRDDFARRTQLVQRFRERYAAKLSPRNSRENHHYYIAMGDVPHSMEALNKAAAAFSIDLRHPFLDRRVVEFCLALPPEQKRRNGYVRAIERNALAAYLSPEVRTRISKVASDAYIRHALLKFDRERLDRIFTDDAPLIEQCVDSAAVRSAFLNDEHTLVSRMWNVLALALWFRQTGLKLR